MMKSRGHNYRFGEFVLEVSEHRLKRGEQEVFLRPKSFETLLYLVEHHSHLIAKEELLDQLWSDTVVTENALTQAIKELRHALEDDAHHPRYIQTVPRVGYKFISEVEAVSLIVTETEEEVEEEFATVKIKVSEEGEATEVEPGQLDDVAHWPLRERGAFRSADAPALSTGLAASHSGRRKLARMILAASAVLVVIILVLIIAGRLHFFPGKRPRIHSVAVLPFANLSADPEQEYFADGMTEALIANLAKLGGVRVISRTSVMRYKKVKKSLPEIARELNVDALVEGSVQLSGSRVRVTAKLIRAPADELIWAEDYDREARDIIPLEKEVSQAIAREIKVELTPQDHAGLASRRTINPAAYKAYLKGRYCCNKRTKEGFRKGIEYFRQAIEQEPNYAAAYVGLADSYNLLSGYDWLPPRAAVPKAKEAASRALEIDDTLAEAHASLAFARMQYDWDWEGAERAFRRAIELNPNYAEAHHWYGLYLAMLGRSNEAMAEMNRARELDPLSLIINTNVGWLQYFARQYDRAIETCRETIGLDPHFLSPRVKLAWAYEQEGRYEDAIVEFQNVLNAEGNDPVSLALVGHAYAVSGRRAEAQKIAGELTKRSRSEYVSAYWVALIFVGLGEKDQAFEWLQKAYQERSGWLAWLKVDPKLDGLRSDERFGELLRLVRLQ